MTVGGTLVSEIPKADGRPTMLFLRRYMGFTGGHLKYCNHLGHVAAHGRFRPILHVTPGSRAGELDTFLPPGIERVDLPHKCDAIFVAGVDWRILDECGQDTRACPVINLLQGVRHADPDLPLYRFLGRPALRICVSREVADAIEATGQTNGPVHVVKNGLDHSFFARIRKSQRKSVCLVAGLKAPDLARQAGEQLTTLGIDNLVLTSLLPRDEFLSLLSEFELVILLPKPTEGFYLPALEAMALDVNVVMPDCVGARSFAVDGETCMIGPRSAEALADKAAQLLRAPEMAARLREGGRSVSSKYDITRERRQLNEIIDQWIT